MGEYLVGVYKEVGKNPDIVKIKNQKEYLEKLLDGEYLEQEYDDYFILYKKDSERLLPNVYVDQYSKIGISIRGKILAVGKDEKGNLISLNKDKARRCITFCLRKSFNYKNCDEYGRPLPRSKKKNKKIFKNKNDSSSNENKPKEESENKPIQEKAVQQEQPSVKAISLADLGKALNVKNEDFEKNFQVAKKEKDTQEKNTSNSNEDANSDTKQQSSINDSSPIVVKLSDEQTLNMILKITFLIIEFVKNALEDSEENDE